MIPYLLWGHAMQHVTTPEVCRLTGLSTQKLREWTSRRALVPADVPSRRQGSPAKFAWATVLVLRLAVVLREQFCVELQANQAFLADLRKELGRTPFLSLRGQALALLGRDRWVLLERGEVPLTDALVIHLDPHLEVLSAGFSIQGPTSGPSQRDLFPLSGLLTRVETVRAKTRKIAGRRGGS
jgi:hypothetical protein